ncbi:hypothetical protein K435DRAFT_869049 [Dendrothele bispora CBS 962.96]|uniref:Uncharacterized protein n=1 Tax=Dendrothele bispora (strain CBS 962.96) TaxID=1314807 RepID=A0A4S8LBI8_DENBC|nr:hypothetical protein K435DRAFT_869049 [Dendrothele bispora CBS 962.96]
MAAECRRIGEAGFAQQQLQRADSEGEPRRREWADVAKICEDEDALIRDWTIGDSMRNAEIHSDALGRTLSSKFLSLPMASCPTQYRALQASTNHPFPSSRRETPSS